jgi:hypothetical protein
MFLLFQLTYLGATLIMSFAGFIVGATVAYAYVCALIAACCTYLVLYAGFFLLYRDPIELEEPYWTFTFKVNLEKYRELNPDSTLTDRQIQRRFNKGRCCAAFCLAFILTFIFAITSSIASGTLPHHPPHEL